MKYLVSRYCMKKHIPSATSSVFTILSTNKNPKRNYCSSSDNQPNLRRAVASFQPTGELHVGQYFGVIQYLVALQDTKCDIYLSLTDLQSLTRLPPKSELRANILSTAATLIACGIDIDKTALFQQSKVPYQAQLDWILHCIVDQHEPRQYFKHASRMASIKDLTLGQYVSPLLKCADLLLYGAHLAPIGDQFQNQYDMSVRCSKLFNQKFDEYLILPEPCVRTGPAAKIRSLRKPFEHMSHYETDPRSRIGLLDSPDVIVEKCKKAVTDFTSEVFYDPVNRPGISNIMSLHSLVTQTDYDTIREESVSLESAEYKIVVADAIIHYLKPIREGVNYLMEDPIKILIALEQGAKKACIKAEETIQMIHESIGFQPRIPLHFVPEFKAREEKRFQAPLSTPKSVPVVESKEGKRKVIFSGIQPTGVLHLGNYFGAVKQWVDLQTAGHDVTICIVDQHSITVPQPRLQLHYHILGMAASIIACGIDPVKSCLFQQSLVPQHAQLNTILRCLAHVALLARQSHFKDKVSTLKDSPSLGLFSYPVLQAADILLYRTTHVPVGDDQKQHIQVARQIARMFNKRYGNILYLPEPMILDESLSRLKSLCQPTKKMSKSESNPNSRIEILDSADEILLKCQEAYVDCSHSATLNDLLLRDHSPPDGLDNLMAMHSIVSGKKVCDLQNEHGNHELCLYKVLVADSIENHLKPIREKAAYLLQDKGCLMDILDKGAKQARGRAEETIQRVHEAVGFGRY